MARHPSHRPRGALPRELSADESALPRRLSEMLSSKQACLSTIRTIIGEAASANVYDRV
jgi:hypothetical protein